MRAPCYACLGVVAVATLSLAACEKSDVGRPCGTRAEAMPAEPVLGEDPVNEVVRLERDGVCESFQCLRHAGLSPYCTKTCDFVDVGSTKSCRADADCDDTQYCAAGICKDDDCPPGFWCTSVQSVGPLAGERFCTRKTCSKNLDCEEPGDVECVIRGCYDSCLQTDKFCTSNADCPGGMPCVDDKCACDYRQLVCEPKDDLEANCSCPGRTVGQPIDCPDVELACITCGDDAAPCTPVGGRPPWPTGAVVSRGYCELKD